MGFLRRYPRVQKVLARTAIAVGLLVLAAQVVPVERENPPVEADFDGPEEVRLILREKCYDCHSNEAVWPWYSRVAPVSWWVADHVKEGRRELNFSRWGLYSDDQKEEKMGEIYDEILDKFMPLPSYLIMHPDAAVTETEFEMIERWIDGDLE